jgi:hypothetical protein
MPNAGMNAAGPSNDEYETPPWLFKALDTEFGFDYDAACRLVPMDVVVKKDAPLLHLPNPNILCASGTTDIVAAERMGELKGRRVWCNPPYSLIEMFTTIALRSSAKLWAFLLPSRTGTDWYHDLWARRAVTEFRPQRKRIQFLLNGLPPLDEKGKPQGPRFDSLVAIVRPK